MDARKWNLMIAIVNNNEPRSKAEENFSPSEMKTYDRMVADLAKLRERYPEAAYHPVESDW